MDRGSMDGGNKVDCNELEIWLDDAELIPLNELEEKDPLFAICPACQYNYTLWDAILVQCVVDGHHPTTEYGNRVFAAVALETDIEDGLLEMSQITARELDDLRILKAERRKLKAFKDWELAQESAARTAKQKHG